MDALKKQYLMKMRICQCADTPDCALAISCSHLPPAPFCSGLLFWWKALRSAAEECSQKRSAQGALHELRQLQRSQSMQPLAFTYLSICQYLWVKVRVLGGTWAHHAEF